MRWPRWPPRVSEEEEETSAQSAEEALEDIWPALAPEERAEAFSKLPRAVAGSFFLARSARSQALLVHAAPHWERRLLMRMLAPDDAADVLQEFPPEERTEYFGYLDDRTRTEVIALLAYQEDEAGGLMNPRFVRVRPDMGVDEAIAYVRRQSRERAETINYLYVLDAEQKLLGVLSFRDLFAAVPSARVSDAMQTNVVTVFEHTDQEEVAHIIADNDVLAVPVIDAEGRMRGIVTVDDIVDVVQTEATEDIQKIGGMEALGKPYLQTTFPEMLKKRGPWLALLFVGEMLTASAMAFYEHEIVAVVALALFIPLIISSGGNSGSQATTLIIRAMALGEVRLRDAFRVVGREIRLGLAMGLMLGLLGFARVVLWSRFFPSAYPAPMLIGIVVGVAVIGVVAWGTMVGALLPFLLRRVGWDPASASAPLVATLVDVFGVIIYFGVAKIVLTGTLL